MFVRDCPWKSNIRFLAGREQIDTEVCVEKVKGICLDIDYGVIAFLQVDSTAHPYVRSTDPILKHWRSNLAERELGHCFQCYPESNHVGPSSYTDPGNGGN